MHFNTVVTVLITFLSLLLSVSTNLDTYHTVIVLDDLMLGCGHEFGALKKWTYFEQVIYFLNITVDKKYTTSTLLIKNYSMIITDVSLFHEGIYKCVCGENFEIYRHHVEVQGLFEEIFFSIILLKNDLTDI